jgi:hypothetical protein
VSAAVPSPLESRNAAERTAAVAAERARNDAERDRALEKARVAAHQARSGHAKREDDLAQQQQRVADELDHEIARDLCEKIAPLVARLRAEPSRADAAALIDVFIAADRRALDELGFSLEIGRILLVAFLRDEAAKRPEAITALGGLDAFSAAVASFPAVSAQRCEQQIRAGNVPALVRGLDDVDAAVIELSRRATTTDQLHTAHCRDRLERAAAWASSGGYGRASEAAYKQEESERQAAARADWESNRLKIKRYRAGEYDGGAEGAQWCDAADRLDPGLFGPLLRHTRGPFRGLPPRAPEQDMAQKLAEARQSEGDL